MNCYFWKFQLSETVYLRHSHSKTWCKARFFETYNQVLQFLKPSCTRICSYIRDIKWLPDSPFVDCVNPPLSVHLSIGNEKYALHIDTTYIRSIKSTYQRISIKLMSRPRLLSFQSSVAFHGYSTKLHWKIEIVRKGTPGGNGKATTKTFARQMKIRFMLFIKILDSHLFFSGTRSEAIFLWQN